MELLLFRVNTVVFVPEGSRLPPSNKSRSTDENNKREKHDRSLAGSRSHQLSMREATGVRA